MMNKLQLAKYSATIIGLLLAIPGMLSLFSIELDYLFKMGIISLLPIALPMEYVGSYIGNNYTFTSFLVLVVVSTIFSVSTFLLFHRLNTKKKPISHWKVIIFYLAQYFVIHPLVIYTWVFFNSKNAGDGQFIFGILEIYPISSLIYLGYGFMMDHMKNKFRNIAKVKAV
ncbi:hypothetical protein KMW28_03630 [Flammeovirga yaeyamensis]|uniref:Uncharacterized protein n=1 Tax=Flammeovirga yaeyamensis TaxID=367791 RepID=A0AAX1N538_9BACT|nr:hypothetical protein [Flammeovirga yaeyamensis]MBB3701262.1 hypothetical protein [Flammeovirga yaeyamensis]NMF38268.1 hypothetical protein [Flammeovirga yaeyamensis]QWG02679.1 hypothetical protein KMW28_03630 [Flammeovirga yaeyamensis]